MPIKNKLKPQWTHGIIYTYYTRCTIRTRISLKLSPSCRRKLIRLGDKTSDRVVDGGYIIIIMVRHRYYCCRCCGARANCTCSGLFSRVNRRA